MRKFIKLIKEKWLKETSLTLLLVVLILAVFLAINTIFKNANINPLDFTSEKIYSLSNESKDEISKIEQNVTLYFFGYTESETTVVLGKQYALVNNKINVQLITTSERPDLASKYNIKSTDKLVAVASSQRYKVIESSDMYTYDSSTEKTIDVTEQKLTNAILDVTVVNKPQVYFLTGHGEYGISSQEEMYTLAQYITNDVNDVNTLDLLSTEVPEKCDLLVIANPVKDFTDVETEKILNYINNGGNIVWLQDPYINIQNYDTTNFVNTNKILAQYGISFSKGIVCESNTDSMVSGYPDLIIPSLSYNTIVKDIFTDGKLVIPDAGKISNASDEELEELNVTAEPFVKTTEDAYYKESFDSIKGMEKAESDEEGTFIIGEKLTKKIDDLKSSSLVAFSNAFFVTNYQIQIGQTYSTPINLRNNKDILLNSVADLTNREDSIRIRKDTGLINFNTATAKQDLVVRAIIFIVPIVLIIVGIVITIIRKRRK